MNRAAPVAELAFVSMDRHDLWPGPGGRAVVACSGGADSVVLARLLAPLLADRGHAVTLACLDHGWRPDARDDVAFVADLAGVLDVAFVTAARPSPAPLTADLGREGAARAVRRSWLAGLAPGPADRIYLGHQRDDQLETVLLRREQGLPPERAAVMAWRDGPWCRPLLDRPRSALRQMATGRGWPWREDPTNSDLSLDRNRIRRRTVPDLSVDEVERLLQQGRVARARIDAHRIEARRLGGRAVVDPGPDRALLDRVALVAAPREVALMLLRQLCGGSRQPGRAVLAALLDDCVEGRPARLRDLGRGWTGLVAGDRVELSRRPLHLEGPEPAAQQLPEECHVEWPGGWTFGCRRLDPAEARRRLAEPDAGLAFAAFDPDTLAGPVTVRAAGSGLRLRPFGLRGHSKVRDLLAQAGVPRPERAGWPVLVDANDEVLWLPGIRASSVAPVADSGAAIMLYTVAAPPPTKAPAITPGTP